MILLESEGTNWHVKGTYIDIIMSSDPHTLLIIIFFLISYLAFSLQSTKQSFLQVLSAARLPDWPLDVAWLDESTLLVASLGFRELWSSVMGVFWRWLWFI